MSSSPAIGPGAAGHGRARCAHAQAGTVLEFMGIQGRTYTVQGSPDLKEWNDVSFQVDGEEGEFEHVRANKVRKFRITVPSEEAGAPVKFFKLMVQ